jgi:hypothetical protein
LTSRGVTKVHRLFFFQAQIVGGDALGKFNYKVARRCGVLTFFDHFQVVILAVLCGVVTSKKVQDLSGTSRFTPPRWNGGTIRYQPTRASAAAWRSLIVYVSRLGSSITMRYGNNRSI